MKASAHLTLALLLLSLPGHGAETPSGATPAENRFLFVVDTSFSMCHLDQASREVVFELIHNGLHQQMRAGDTFSIWTFNSEPHVGKYPLQVWDPRKNLDLAGAASKFLKAQRYGGESRLDRLFKALSQVIGAAQDVNIFILSDGDAPIVGTPFDRNINATYRTQIGKLRLAKKPFLTTLVARGGQFTHWSVTIGDQYFRLPDAPELVPIKAIISAAQPSAAPNARESVAGEPPNPDLPPPNPLPIASDPLSIPIAASAPITTPPAPAVASPSSQHPGQSTPPAKATVPARATTSGQMPSIASELEKPNLVLDTNQPSPPLTALAPTSGSEARTEPNPSAPPSPPVAAVHVEPPVQPIPPTVNDPKSPAPATAAPLMPTPPPASAGKAVPPAAASANASAEAPPPKPATARSAEPAPPADGHGPAGLTVAARELPSPEPPQATEPKTTAPTASPPAILSPAPVSARTTAPAAALSPEATPLKPAGAPSTEPRSPAPRPAPAGLTVAARELPRAGQPSLAPPEPSPFSVAASLPTKPEGDPRSLLVAGGALLVAALGLGVLAIRRLRPAPERSLISQSLDRR